ncbi:uncharacterized protein LOC129216574 [Uloborus diversus]|uniref:uncharacterized protein LOC129216574 n=1 Tax=Uloborus diversus TaxID=327109 RepID=UPI00240925F9|nr:uncharacterized protein LOC129216574 [Uloborus diversus]
MPKDGSRWKVIGDGGQEGWQVVDDKGDVEWKIEYDQGEWRVTSAGDAPADVEWADPDYLWEPADGSLSEEDDYSWPVDDYAYVSPWADPGQYVRGSGNYSWPAAGDGNLTGEHVKASGIQVQPINTDWRIGNPTGNTNIEKTERIQFGTRHRTQSNDNIRSNPAEDRTDKTEDSDKLDHTDILPENKPQADEVRTDAKSWNPNAVAVKNGPEWVQGYGSKTWEGDNTGWNVAYGGDTWLAANKDLSSGQWVPKAVAGQVQVLPQKLVVDPGIPGKLENPIRAWGTGYGSKTWKGNEWNSNVVWNTGFGGALPWSADNVTWTFPNNQNEYGYEGENKKPVTWSQPLPNSNANLNETPGSTLKVDGVRIKWPSRPISGTVKKSPPNRRTEGESWGDDSSSGGVVWKVQKANDTPSNEPTGNKQDLWKSGGDWKAGAQDQDGKAAPVPPKTSAPPKSSNLLSVAWKTTGDSPVDAVPVVRAPWNQVQWPNRDSSNGPTWTFGGCKMTIKCGVPESDDADDSPELNISDDSDSSMPPTDAPPVISPKGWPKKQNKEKSWIPPAKTLVSTKLEEINTSSNNHDVATNDTSCYDN